MTKKLKFKNSWILNIDSETCSTLSPNGLAGRASFPPERFVACPCRYLPDYVIQADGRGLAGWQVHKDILETKLPETDTDYILISFIFIWKMYVY
ncbi:MAG: hypothetical protein ACUZ8I_09135 [Candidatus Scalindua sp.]